jgi:putative two-component system response regulator
MGKFAEAARLKKQILIVDDDQRMLDALQRALHRQNNDWDMTFIRRPEEAWESLLQFAYDAVVTDVRMPGISGIELLERIRRTEKTKDVPVVILTGLNDHDLKEKALLCGAVDLMNKPVDTGQLIARIKSVLQMKQHQDELRVANRSLAEQVQQQSADLAQTRMSVICRLGMAAEFRDEDTGNHVVRVACLSRAIAAAMNVPEAFLDSLLLAAPLHDIGKIGIPDSVLLKAGPLTDDEWEIMQRHCEIGACILREQSQLMIPMFNWCAIQPPATKDSPETRDPVLEMAATIALSHHEKWNGSGYPRGLAGGDIPLEARIVAVADVFDALTSNRPYRPARPEQEALTIMDSTAGTHFDPRVYAAFTQSLPEIRAIRERFSTDEFVFSRLQGEAV